MLYIIDSYGILDIVETIGKGDLIHTPVLNNQWHLSGIAKKTISLLVTNESPSYAKCVTLRRWLKLLHFVL